MGGRVGCEMGRRGGSRCDLTIVRIIIMWRVIQRGSPDRKGIHNISISI